MWLGIAVLLYLCAVALVLLFINGAAKASERLGPTDLDEVDFYGEQAA